MVLEAYSYLAKMISSPQRLSNTHASPTHISPTQNLHTVMTSKPQILFTQPINTAFTQSSFYRHPSPTTLLIEEQDALPEGIEIKHEDFKKDFKFKT